MCGIVALVAGPGASRGQLADLVARLTGLVSHRGPDDAGAWVDAERGVALGHRRLAIVDLSPHGHQPMVSDDGRYVLSYNGEVYGQGALRDRLLAGGARLRGHSDTEVLLEAVARWGLEAVLPEVNGMFALALWDRREGRLTIARDRLGEKPLYYGRVGDVVVVASELRVIRALPGAPSAPEPEALALYLRHGFVPAPWTALAGVRKLPPGCTLVVDPDGGPGEPRAWWRLADAVAAGRDESVDDRSVVDRVEALLLDSVRRRRDADVPVGTFLSGGVDSSLVAALLAHGGRPPRTFTVAVGGTADESQRAAAIAAHLGTEHTTVQLPPVRPEDAVDVLTRTYDEPFADPSALPTALLCRAAREHVTVCLSGDGGDEVFAGYNRYRVAGGVLGAVGRLPRGVRRAGAGLVRRTPDPWWQRLAPDVMPAKLAGVLAADDPYGAYVSLATVWQPSALLGRPSAEPPTAVTAPPSALGAAPLDRMLAADQLVTLPDDMLVKVDRASMAVGLEVRVPLLDHRVVELSWSLPGRALVRDGRGKWVLREVLRRHLPDELVEGPKRGFDPPLGPWLRGPLREWAQSLLDPGRLSDLGLRAAPVTAAWRAHVEGRGDRTYQLWTVLALSAWAGADVEEVAA